MWGGNMGLNLMKPMQKVVKNQDGRAVIVMLLVGQW